MKYALPVNQLNSQEEHSQDFPLIPSQFQRETYLLRRKLN